MKTRRLKIALTNSILAVLTHNASAQMPNILNGAFIKEHTPTKRVVPYPHSAKLM